MSCLSAARLSCSMAKLPTLGCFLLHPRESCVCVCVRYLPDSGLDEMQVP